MTLNGAGGYQDASGSLWMYSITELDNNSSNAMAAWLWDDTSITCPGTTGCPSLSKYSDYKTLEGKTITITRNATVTYTREPILLEK